VTGPQIDYMAVYRQLPVPVLLLTPEFVIADVNLAFLQTTGRALEDVLGRYVFDAFPDNPWDPGDTGVRKPSRVAAPGPGHGSARIRGVPEA
jgi:PAS domain-containing protein